MADGVEPAHPGQHVAYEGHGGQPDKDGGEDIDGLVGPAAVILAGELGQLHVGEPQADGRGIGNNQQQEHHNAQTADKMRGRTPENQAAGQGLHVFQDGGARGGETGHALEPGVDYRERPAPEGIRQGPENEGQEPREKDNHKTVPEGNLGVLAGENEGEDSQTEGDGKANQERRQGAVSPVDEGHPHRQQHEEGAHQEGHSHISGYDFKIHLFP